MQHSNISGCCIAELRMEFAGKYSDEESRGTADETATADFPGSEVPNKHGKAKPSDGKILCSPLENYRGSTGQCGNYWCNGM